MPISTASQAPWSSGLFEGTWHGASRGPCDLWGYKWAAPAHDGSGSLAFSIFLICRWTQNNV